jgi:acetyltransferase-like isoleucine patch superfamily enzyme
MSHRPRPIPSYDPDLQVEWGEDCFLGAFTVIGIRPMANAANRRLIDRGTPQRVTVGDRSLIGTHCTIYHDVAIGEDCRVGDHAIIREACRIGARCVVGQNVDLQYNVRLGDDVKILNETQITGNSVIGKGVFIGPGVQSMNDDALFRAEAEDYRDRGQVGITIGDYVRIGGGAILLPGIKIGHHAIVAAGALVTRDVEPHAAVKGLPARAA